MIKLVLKNKIAEKHTDIINDIISSYQTRLNTDISLLRQFVRFFKSQNIEIPVSIDYNKQNNFYIIKFELLQEYEEHIIYDPVCKERWLDLSTEYMKYRTMIYEIDTVSNTPEEYAEKLYTVKSKILDRIRYRILEDDINIALLNTLNQLVFIFTNSDTDKIKLYDLYDILKEENREELTEEIRENCLQAISTF